MIWSLKRKPLVRAQTQAAGDSVDVTIHPVIQRAKDPSIKSVFSISQAPLVAAGRTNALPEFTLLVQKRFWAGMKIEAVWMP